MRKVRCPPPKRFLPAGRVTKAWLSDSVPPFLSNPRRRGSKANGIRYERKALTSLESRYPNLLRSPWFRFVSSGCRDPRWCQPDGLIFDPFRGIIFILEVKLKHTADAWWQVRHLYEPVVAACFGSGPCGADSVAGGVSLWKIAAVQVVRWFDPDTPFPEPFRVVPDIANAKPEEFSIFIQREN